MKDALDAFKVAVHCGARGLRVTSRDRSIDIPMLEISLVALMRAAARRDQAGDRAHALEHRAIHVGPAFIDDGSEHSVVAREADAHVKQVIGGAVLRSILRGADHRDGLGDGGDFGRRGQLCGERGNLRLDGAPRRDQFERRGAGALEQASVRRAVLRLDGDEGAGAHPHLDEAGDFQRDHGFAHGGTADAEQPCEVALRRQPVARLELAARDEVSDLTGDLFVKSLRRDGLKRHAQSSRPPFSRRFPAGP